jgi:hypothetical protein
MAEAGNLFFSVDPGKETLYSRIVPTDEQIALLQSKWNSLADILRDDLAARSGYPVKTWLQGSYKYGTMIRPVSIWEEYDVDLGFYFCWTSGKSTTPAPTQMRTWVQDGLHASLGYLGGARSIDDPPKERCSRVHYDKQFHVDIPVYHLDEDSDKRRLATLTKGWEASDPKKLYQWLLERFDREDRTRMRRVVRYLKAWAALAFAGTIDKRPSSTLLTVLVADAFDTDGASGEDDEDVFCAVVASIRQRLREDRRVPNPVDNSEDLNRIPAAHWNAFLESMDRLHDTGQRALVCEDEAAAAWIWDEAFSYLFPPPQEDASVEFEGSQALSIVPDIQIDVQDSRGHLVDCYSNEVPGVDKNHKLIFRITNPAVVPAWATVDWVVRNTGSECEDTNDIGHHARGTRDFVHEERTAYNGRHFMDCIIRQQSQVLAVRRVPVYVRTATFRRALPPKPYYRRFVRRRR